MEIVEIILIVAVIITISNVLSKILPNIPIFVLQIILGVLLGFTQVGRSIHFEPDLFLLLIIAPLLFREGENADIRAILKNIKVILSLSFGLVILTLVGVGWLLHLLLPGVPIAACFALGAALGPTDAVAVGSLAKRLKIPSNTLHILEGEGLLNDASGVTAFQFALAALITGSFSLAGASFQLVFSSIGGVVLGFVIVWIKRQIIKIIERASAKDITSYLIIELILPFVAYIIAEELHVSGIITAVVTGVLQASTFRRVHVFDAELANLSEATWSTIVFTLNSLVFLFLGIELSLVVSPMWTDRSYANWHLFLIVLALAAFLFALRFCYLGISYLIGGGFKNVKDKMQEILLLTFGGVKGTVSLATIFILPATIHGVTFEHRSLLLFITAGTILITLIVGMIILPQLADETGEVPRDRPPISILESVVSELEQDMQNNELTEKELTALEAVISNYRYRIHEHYEESLTTSDRQEMQEIQSLVVSIERDGLDEMYQKHKIKPSTYRLYSNFIRRFNRSFRGQVLSLLGIWLMVGHEVIRALLHPIMFIERQRKNGKSLDKAEMAKIQKLFEFNSQQILLSLEGLRGMYEDELIQLFIEDRTRLMKRMQLTGGVLDTVIIQQESVFIRELIRGYYLERKIIDEFESYGDITTRAANNYRHRVNLLESYAMAGLGEAPPIEGILRRIKHQKK
jgi:CPA1 family monovalent cation:H+ antiporter